MQREGNSEKYSIDYVIENEDKTLFNKRFLFLGSSITLGACSLETSFADYLAKRNRLLYIKEAVNGTTLVDKDEQSYISRLKKIDTKLIFDYVVCQLSTNDATLSMPLGDENSQDMNTIGGAINFIIDYVKDKWNKKVIFFTNSFYDNGNYKKMVDLIKRFEAMNKIFLIDLFSDKEFNNINLETRNLYMADSIHPTKAGYLLWWTPIFEKRLIEINNYGK